MREIKLNKILKIEKWQGYFPLNNFSKKLNDPKTRPSHLYKNELLRMSFSSIRVVYSWIGTILKRIDTNFTNDINWMKIIETVEHAKQLSNRPPSDLSITNIDVISLILFLNILMDDVTRFLNHILKGKHKPKTRSFNRFKKSLTNYDGEHIPELNNIIQETTWYKELKDLRDDNIVHKGEKDTWLVTGPGEVGVYISYYEGGQLHEKFVSNKVIDVLCQNVFNFLTRLDEFLCENFEDLPLEIYQHV